MHWVSLAGLAVLWLFAPYSSAPIAFAGEKMTTMKSASGIKKNESRECVVLLHGLARTSRSMKKMEKMLLTAGYSTVNLDYPSTKKEINELVSTVFTAGVDACEAMDATTIHFVTHSMGGIIVRAGLKQKRPVQLGKVVMLSPPNQGSDVAEKLKDWWLYKMFNGPAGQSLGTGEDSIPNRLGPVNYPVGVITGNRHAFFDAWFSTLIPGEDDGKVAVAHTKVEGMADFLVLPETHPFIMNGDKVIAQTIHFLQHGRFAEAAPPSTKGHGTGLVF